MKRVLALGALVLVLALSGCMLGWDKDISYTVSVNGSLGKTLKITFMNENGDLQTESSWLGGDWGQSFSVSGKEDEPFLAFINVDTTASGGPFTLDVTIRVDGSVKDFSTSTTTFPQVSAFYLVD